VRGNFAIKACWECITKPKKRTSNYSPNIQTCYALTTRVDKIDYNTRTEHYGVNVWYERNRDLLYKIWNHPRVLAYPAGKRWLAERDDGTMLPVANEIQGNVQSLDRFEIMYTHTEQDKFGNHYGPRMTASKLPDLVRYIKTATGRSINRHIDYFIDNVLTNQSTPQSYQPFFRHYNKYIKAAKVNEDRRKKLFVGTQCLRIYNKIDRAMKAIHKITLCMSRNNIRQWTTLTHLHPEHIYFFIEKKKMQRLLLLYTEITYLKAKWFLTYDTGCPQLDKTIHSILGDLLAKPTSMTRKKAKQYAKTLYLSCNHLVEMSHVPGLWANRSLGIIATTFQTRYQRPYTSERESHFPAWQDTSGNRNR